MIAAAVMIRAVTSSDRGALTVVQRPLLEIEGAAHVPTLCDVPQCEALLAFLNEPAAV